MAFDQPAVLAVEPLCPPAVTDAQVRHAVEGCFHAAGAARLERLARIVQPHVAAMHQVVGEVHVVIVDKREAAAEFRIEGVSEHALQMMLGRFIRRVGLAGEHDLHRPVDRGQDPHEAIRVMENQLWPLIGGEPAGVSQRQRIRIQHAAGGDDARRPDVFAGPARPHPLADEAEQVSAHGVARGPDLGVGNIAQALPELRLVDVIEPSRPEVLVQ